MSYDKLPDNDEEAAQYIADFGQERKTYWQKQSAADKEADDLYLKMEEQDTSIPKRLRGKVAIKPLRAGIAGYAVDRNAASLASAIYMHMAPKSTKRTDIDHANRVLEPWLMGTLDRAAISEVMIPKIRDMLIISRGISNFFPCPALWAGGEYRKMVEELQRLAEENSRQVETGGRDPKLLQEMDDLDERIATFKERNFPLRWRLTNPRATWPLLSEERWLPEMVEIRKMTRKEIEDNFGLEALPDAYLKSSSQAEIEVYDYANHAWTATVIPSFSKSWIGGNVKSFDSRLVRRWNHNLGINPYVFFEGIVLQENEKGIRWKSILYDFKDILESINETLTDIRQIHRREGSTYAVANVNIEARQRADPLIAGDAAKVPIGPNENNIVVMGPDEKLSAGPTTQVNPTSIQLLSWLTEYAFQIVMNPTLLGLLKSGTSAVAFDAATFQASQNMLPYEKAIVRGLKHLGTLMMRSVTRLHAEFPDSAEPIVVVDEKMGVIEVRPKDVRGWEAYLQPRLKSMGPISKNQQANLAVTLNNVPGLSPAKILEMSFDMEDAEAEVERWEKWQIELVLMEMVKALTQRYAGVVTETTGATSTAGLAEEIAGLPPAAQMALAGNQVPQAQQALGAARQVAPNVTRAGTPQGMSTLAGVGEIRRTEV